MNAESDLSFLKELKQRFTEYRDGNLVQGDYVVKMIDDWIDELSDMVATDKT